MEKVEKVAQKHDKAVNELIYLFKNGKVINDIEQFRHYARHWYNLGYAVGNYEKELSK